MTTNQDLREAVRSRYATAALTVLQGERADSGPACCSDSSAVARALSDREGAGNYSADETASLPDAAVKASLGCGNPTALIDLQPGQVVLDLGSGGGIDVLLSAKRVGPTGKAYGLDMTDEMLDLAKANAKSAGVGNVEFLKGQIEAIPLPAESVDVIISNCVINLSTDKAAVLGEAFRVLKPGGRFAVSDIVVVGPPLGPKAHDLLALWAGCVAGALTVDEYEATLSTAGFQDVDLEVVNGYGASPEEAALAKSFGVELEAGQQIVSAFIRATKPVV